MSSTHRLTAPIGVPHTCICGRLLGVQRGTELHIREKRARFVACGPVVVTCARCETTTTLNLREGEAS